MCVTVIFQCVIFYSYILFKSPKRPKIRFRWRSGKRRSSANVASCTPPFRGEKLGVADALLRAKDLVDLSLST